MHGYIFLQGFAVAMTRRARLYRVDWLLRGHDRRSAAGPGTDQRRGNLTAAGLCVASACGVGANSAGDGVRWL